MMERAKRLLASTGEGGGGGIPEEVPSGGKGSADPPATPSSEQTSAAFGGAGSGGTQGTGDGRAEGAGSGRTVPWGERLATAVSLLAFGGAIGLMAGLSKFAGTTSTLIGLLIALIGGSLAPLLKAGEATLERSQRDQTYRAAGVVSSGLILGLLAAFGLRWYEATTLTPSRHAQYLQLLDGLKARGVSLSNVAVPAAESLVGADPAFQLQVYAAGAGGGPASAPAKAEPQASDRRRPASDRRQDALDAALRALAGQAQAGRDAELEASLRELDGYLKLSGLPAGDLAQLLRRIEARIPADSPRGLLELRAELKPWADELAPTAAGGDTPQGR